MLPESTNRSRLRQVGNSHPGRELISKSLFAAASFVKSSFFASYRISFPLLRIAMSPSRAICVILPPYWKSALGWLPDFAHSIHSSQWLWGRASDLGGRL